MTALEDLLPAPLDLPADFDRHDPAPEDLREAMRTLLAAAPAQPEAWPTLVDYLFAVGRSDIPTARLVEAHVDAMRIHAEAGTRATPGALYGVWASRSHATGVHGVRRGDTWILDGTLRFASGSGIVDRALVPVWTTPDTHVLLDLDVSAWTFDGGRWRTRAMAPARSHEASFHQFGVEARRVGEDNFYLSRPGFFRGGVGVAAAWVGSAARAVDLARHAVAEHRRSPAQSVRFGRVTTDLVGAHFVIRQAARHLQTDDTDARTLSTLTRASAAAGVRRIVADLRSVAGPAGLAFDEDLTRALDDTFLFTAQQNEDADALWLGGAT